MLSAIAFIRSLWVQLLYSGRRTPRGASQRLLASNPTSSTSAVYVGLLFVVLLWGGALQLPRSSDLATPLFQLTLPGLGEELVFRGILQSLLNESFGRPVRLGRIACGWSLPVVAVLFAMCHGVSVDSGLHLQLSFGAMIFPLIIGLVLGWLRERAGNIWPGVLLHTVIDGAAALLG